MTVFYVVAVTAVAPLNGECSMSLAAMTKSEGSWREHVAHGNYVT